MSDIHLLLKNWRERKIGIKNSCWFVKVVSLTFLFNFCVKFENTIQKFRFSFDPI